MTNMESSSTPLRMAERSCQGGPTVPCQSNKGSLWRNAFLPIRANVQFSLTGAAVLWVMAARLASAISPTSDEMAEAQRWAAAKFEEGTSELRQAGRSAPSVEPFFSFTYDGRPSAEVLKTWTFERTRRLLDGKKTEHTLTYRDPKTGLVLRCIGIQYGDFPTVEWTLYFRNGGDKDTPILADICALDIQVEGTAAKDRAKSLSQNRRGLAHFAESSEQNVPVPFSRGLGIDSRPLGPQRKTSRPGE